MRGALVATGIGALVVGVGLLIANFDKVKKVILNLIPGLSQVGDFIGSIVNSVTDFVGATSDASRALDKLKANADKTLSVNKKFLQEHSDQIDEYTKKKIEAKNAYSEAVKEEGADQIALAKKLNRELVAIEYSRGDEKRKIQKENDDKLKADRKTETKKLKDEKLAEEMQSAKDALSIQKALQESQESPAQKELREYNEKKAILLANNLDTILLDNEHKENLKKLDETYWASESDKSIARDLAKKALRDKDLSDEKAVADAKKEIQDSVFSAADASIGFLKSISGKNKALQKASIIAESAMGIAKMVISNQAANIGALATPQSIATSGAAAVPVIAFNNIKTAFGIATTIASTAKALGSLGGGSSPSSPSSGGSGGSSPSASPNFNVVGASSTNQLAQTMAERNQQPIKTYVVSGDISTAQSLERNIISSASIG